MTGEKDMNEDEIDDSERSFEIKATNYPCKTCPGSELRQ